MTSDEAKQSITTWCTTDDDLSLVGEGSDPAADFVLKISAGGLSASPVNLEALKGSGADRITLRHASRLSGEGDAATRLVQGRPGWVTLSDDRSSGVTVQTFIYLDGLSKHSFVQAAAELARTGRLLESLAKGASEPADAGVSVPAGVAAGGTPAVAGGYPASTQYAPSNQGAGQYGQQQQGGQPLGTPSFSPAPQQQPSYAPAWAPTHTVPAQGARAWAAPDPAGAVVANLAPGLPIQVTEVRGAWARVVCSNGWTGWIDGRPIGVAA
jgi:Bacterial SH3 domain